MIRRLAAAALAVLAACASQPVSAPPHSEPIAGPDVFDARRADWRIGAVTYQVFVDRYVPSADLDAKRGLYAPPRTLQEWTNPPTAGEKVDGSIHWSHELAFWGGDLASLRTKVGYLNGLGVDVLYLNPIQLADSNHKYDAIDYREISPEYGTKADLRALAEELHADGMHLVLDGVFNHMGENSRWFLDAQSSPDSPYRDWFTFDPSVRNGYVGWWGIAALPELKWENPEVRAEIVDKPDSVVRSWFGDGIDGWRLDVATELGLDNLAAITRASHEERPGSLVIGEVWSYPSRWTAAMDAVMNFALRQSLFAYVEGRVSGPQFATDMDDMIADCGLDPILRSWILLDNHDTPRFRTLYPDERDRAFLQSLQFTLPGSPLVYYGVEAGMEGGEDPGSRGPMQWQDATPANPEFARLAGLAALRKSSPALRVGDYVPLATRSAFAYLRVTDKSEDTVLVVANAGEAPVHESLLIRDPFLMNGDTYRDVRTGAAFNSQSGVLELDVPGKTVLILKPERWPGMKERTGHTPYKRIP